MNRTSSCLVLLIASVFASNVLGDEAAAEVVVREGERLEVVCALRLEQRADWRRDGGPAPADMRAAPERPAPDGRLLARLAAPHARAQHAGLYTCAPRAAPVRVRVHAAAAETAGAAGAAVAEAGDDAPFVFEVGRSLALLCPLTLDTGAVFTWKKNGTAVDDLWDVKDRYKLEEGGAKFQIVGRAHEDDFGNYTCASGAAEHTWDVRGKPVSRLPANTNVVEGQKLKLTCKVTGKPYPKVTWLYSNSTDADANGTEVTLALGARALVGPSEQGVAGAELVLEAARREDAGRYTCSVDAGTSHATVLRVKDMYAALWPFLGICAEVFVLCAVILIYERRRTKPEHDDSDTDNHDQKKS